MADNLIRLKQLERIELSGFILTVSSGERGLTGPTGVTGSSVTGAVQTGVGPYGGSSGFYFLFSSGGSSSVISLPLGPSGLTGLIGPQGYTGAQGATGATGPSGTTGPSGATGPSGEMGPMGAPSGTNGQLQYKSGSLFAGAPIYYDSFQLGVNTSNPNFDLDVAGPDGIRAYSTGTSAKGQLGHEGGGSVIRLYNDAGSSKVKVTSSGNSFLNGGLIGVMNANPSYTFHVNGTGYFNSGLGFSRTTPVSAVAYGISGEMAYDTGFFYVCIANNTWRRASLSSF